MLTHHYPRATTSPGTSRKLLFPLDYIRSQYKWGRGLTELLGSRMEYSRTNTVKTGIPYHHDEHGRSHENDQSTVVDTYPDQADQNTEALPSKNGLAVIVDS
jgi:hypothetical protein